MPHKPKHIHKLIRYLPAGLRVSYKNYRWRCLEKDCFAVFTLDSIREKEFVCSEPACTNTYILSYKQWRVAKPKCIDHDMTKKGRLQREALGLFEELTRT